MKEIYLAMDKSGDIWGYSKKPIYDYESSQWVAHSNGTTLFRPEMFEHFGIDVTKFPLTHETPIKIRAVWEVVE